MKGFHGETGSPSQSQSGPATDEVAIGRDESPPVFYDPTGRRWRWTVGLTLSVTLLFATISAVALYGLFVERGTGYDPPPGGSEVLHFASREAVLTDGARGESMLIGFLDPTDPNSLAALHRYRGYLDGIIVELGQVDDDVAPTDPPAGDIEGLEVLASLSLYEEAAEAVLADATRRARTAKTISRRIEGFDGLHLDLSSLPTINVAGLSAFVEAIRLATGPTIVSVGISAAVDADSLRGVARVADRIVLVPFGSVPGGFFVDLEHYESILNVALSELPEGKTIVAIGAFGRTEDGRALSLTEAMKRAELAGASVTYDAAGIGSLSYEDAGGKTVDVQFADAVTAFNQIARAREIGGEVRRPAGWAVMRLGLGAPDLWKVAAHRDRLDETIALALRQATFDPGVTYVGGGEAIAFGNDGRPGQRRLHYAEATGRIEAHGFEVLPSSVTVRRYGGTTDSKIAITFDDGPAPPYTPRILEILRHYDVKATFFVSGMNAVRYPGLVRRIVAEGHELGHHTFSHPNVSKISRRRFRLELSALQVFIESLVGRRLVLFRPPYSEAAEPVKAADVGPLRILDEAGYLLVTSHIDPRDWNGKPAAEIERLTVDLARQGAGRVALLHDGGGDRSATVAALPGIIETLQGDGFEIMPLADLLGVDRDSIMPPVSQRRAMLTRAYRAAFSSAGAVVRVAGVLFSICIALGMSRAALMIVLSIAGKLRERKRKPVLAGAADGIRASVVVPAYNEEKVVCMTVDSLLESTHPNFEIVVVDDGSTDATFEVLTRAYADHPTVRLFSVPNGGKSAALNFGIAHSTGDVVVTLDADTIFTRKTLSNLVSPFADESVGAVAGNAKVGNRDKTLTRCQALEYITGQNIEKRAYGVINGIPVVPGAVGAWRRSVLAEAGGLAHDTLAEDAELTFRVLRSGHRVVYRDDALGYTEAPDTVRSFVKQRVRWMYGTLQTAWKHRDITFRPKFGALGVFTAPSIYLFQLFFPLFSIIVELTLLSTVGFHVYQIVHHPIGETASLFSLQLLLIFYLLFLLLELAMCFTAFLMEPGEPKGLLWWVVVQRFYYRPILSFVAVRTLYLILRGRAQGWNKLERTATVRINASEDRDDEGSTVGEVSVVGQAG